VHRRGQAYLRELPLPLRSEIENSDGQSSEHLMSIACRLVEAEGDLVGDADAVAFEGDDFFRVIGEDANVLEAEVDQDLCADAAFVLDQALARELAIELAALMKMNLREHARFLGRVDAETAAGVVQIEKDAAVFLGDSFERTGNELRTIARC
jgi:hypothetical protein